MELKLVFDPLPKGDFFIFLLATRTLSLQPTKINFDEIFFFHKLIGASPHRYYENGISTNRII